MATYKVLQDIEAEDKFVGPLTLKQFILAGVAGVSGYLALFMLAKGLWFLSLILAPIVFVSGFLAFPWGRDQPTEVWLLAKIRFMFLPRKRIWDQSGVQELVTITAPKRVEEQFVGDDLSQGEVRSRLKALANTIDSRGWAVKNVNINLYADPGYGNAMATSDRLVEASVLTPNTPTLDIGAADDILDEHNNPTAQHLDQMITASAQNYKQQAVQHMQSLLNQQKTDDTTAKKDKEVPDKWFMKPDKGDVKTKAKAKPKSKSKHVDRLLDKVDDLMTFSSKLVSPGGHDKVADQPLSAAEKAVLDKAHKDQVADTMAYGNLPSLEPLAASHQSHAKQQPKTDKPPMVQAPNPDIINLAYNDDLSVQTIAHEANKKSEPEQPEGEVTVSWR